MASRITALDWDSYKNRDAVDPTISRRVDGGILENEEARLQASFDINRGSRDAEGYAGNDSQGGIPDRMSIVALVKSNPLTVPHLSSSMDDTTAARSAYQYYAGILQGGGPRALQLMRAAASEGNKAVQKAREIGDGENFSVVASHKGAANVTAGLIGIALEAYPASREDAVKRPQQFNAHHEEDVRKTIARAAKENWGNKEGLQVLPNDVSKVDFQGFAKELAAKVEPKTPERLHPIAVDKLLNPAHIVRDKRESSDTFGQIVGLSESLQNRVRPEYHDAIIDHANSHARAGSLAIPPSAILSTKAPSARHESEGGPKGVALSDKAIKSSTVIFADPAGLEAAKAAIAAAGPDQEIIIGSMAKELGAVKTKARVSSVHNPKSKGAYVLKQHGYGEKAAEYLAAGMDRINHASHANFYLGEEPNALNAFLVGHAATRGNINVVKAGDKDLSLPQAQALGAQEFLTPGQMVRRGLADGLDVQADEAAGAVALKLFRNGNDKITNRDVRAIQATGLHLQDILGVVQDPNQARAFAVENGVSSGAMRIIKDGDAASVGTNLPHALQELQGKGLDLVGREDFPAALRGKDDTAVFAVISGDLDAFRNAKGVIGIVGDRLMAPKDNASKEEKESTIRLASTVAAQMAAIENTKQPRAWIEGQTPFPMEPRKGDIVIISGGLGVFNNEAEEKAQQARDLAGAITVSFDAVPSTVVYQAPKGRGKNAKGTQEMVRNLPNEAQAPAAGRMLGQLADRLVVTNGDAAHYTAAKTAVVEQLKDGKRIIAVDPTVSTKASSLNAALLRSDGHKALSDANMGSATVEDPALKAVAGGPVAIRLNPRNPEGAAAGLVNLVKGQPIQGKAEKTAVKTAEDER